MAALRAGDTSKAGREARRLTKMVPNEADAWQLRAMIAQQTEAHEGAAKYLRRARQLKPNDPTILINLGGLNREIGKPEEAMECYRQCLAQQPNSPDAAYNLGAVLLDLDRFGEAETVIRTGLASRPDDYDMLLNLAAALLKQKKLQAALDTYEQLAKLGHGNADVLQGLYQSALGLGQLEEADRAVQRLLEIAGDDPKYHVYASMLYLLTGRWRDGWKAYAARWRWQPGAARPFSQPWWKGEDQAGKTILLWGEQGLGDEVMFASMVPDLVANEVRILLETDKRLVGLFQRSFPNILCLARKDPPDPRTVSADFQLPTTNLGNHFRPDEASFKGGKPFLVPDGERVEHLRRAYRKKFAKSASDLLIGITWRSLNARYGDSKSMLLDDMRPILETPGAAFVNLQYGDTAVECTDFKERTAIVIHHDADIDPMFDIDGHATQVAAMDLIISISNTTAHIAGAMGVPAWIMLHMVPDRRWLMARDDSPWYGSVRLFRQKGLGDWTAPVDRVKRELAELIQGRG